MPSPPLTDLSERAREVFRLVVESYLESGNPVGSKVLAGDGALNLSPASIRSVLADLERTGLLAAPHTSAGRMPTESGLRLFVDGMMQAALPSAAERHAIEQELSQAGAIEAALEKTSAVLSDLSGAAGMVMVPRREPRLSQMSFVALGEGRVLAILVGDNGEIENRIMQVDDAPSASVLEQAANYITARLSGKTLADAANVLGRDIASERSELDSASRDLIERGLAVWSEDASKRPVLIVRGQAKLLDETAMQDIDRVRELLDDLESKQSVAQLLEQAREAQSTRIFIGSENRLFALSGSSVIAAPYRNSEDEVVGVLGVIGPTRLNYARLVPMIDFTARSLGKIIG